MSQAPQKRSRIEEPGEYQWLEICDFLLGVRPIFKGELLLSGIVQPWIFHLPENPGIPI